MWLRAWSAWIMKVITQRLEGLPSQHTAWKSNSNTVCSWQEIQRFERWMLGCGHTQHKPLIQTVPYCDRGLACWSILSGEAGKESCCCFFSSTLTEQSSFFYQLQNVWNCKSKINLWFLKGGTGQTNEPKHCGCHYHRIKCIIGRQYQSRWMWSAAKST